MIHANLKNITFWNRYTSVYARAVVVTNKGKSSMILPSHQSKEYANESFEKLPENKPAAKRLST